MIRRLCLFAFVGLLLGSPSASAASLTLSFHSDPSGVALIGDGSKQAEMNLNTVAKHGGTLPVGLTRMTTDTNWTLSTPFGVKVTKEASVVSSSYTARVKLGNDPAWITWKINSTTLIRGVDVTIISTGTYGVILQQTFTIVIDDAAANGTDLSNSMDWSIIAN